MPLPEAFPRPMLLALKTARLVPVRLWSEAFRLVRMPERD